MQSEKTLLFIEKAKKVHGDKYDYSLVEYLNTTTKVKIICEEHGIFEQLPYNHLYGTICKLCRLKEVSNKMTSNSEVFIKKARKVHGDKYDYSLVDYKHSKEKIDITCIKHNNIFKQTPNNHLRGAGCEICKNEGTSLRCKFDKQDVINKFKNKFKNKYDYSLVEYKGINSKVKIKCNEHKITFQQSPQNHLKGQKGCYKCKNLIKSNKEFIEKARKVHGDKYDYSLVSYSKVKEKVKIICKEHSVFEQQADIHLLGSNCPKCTILKMLKKRTHSIFEFIERARKVHGDKYDYSESLYINSQSKIKIKCPNHGFFIQKANGHLNGKGCQSCSKIIGRREEKLRIFLSSYFSDILSSFRNKKILNKQHIDIFLPTYKIAIEYQGIQHFVFDAYYNKISRYGGLNYLNYLDKKKRDACAKHGIKLFYFSYDTSYVPKDYPYKVYSDEQELLEAINKHIEEQKLIKEKFAS